MGNTSWVWAGRGHLCASWGEESLSCLGDRAGEQKVKVLSRGSAALFPRGLPGAQLRPGTQEVLLDSSMRMKLASVRMHGVLP